MAPQPEARYQFNIHLVDIILMVLRRFITQADAYIAELHYIVQLIMV